MLGNEDPQDGVIIPSLANQQAWPTEPLKLPLVNTINPVYMVDQLANPNQIINRPPATEGLRFDQDKARYDLIPSEFMEALAVHYQRGAKKYGDRNWEKGMDWLRCFGSLMRHAWAWRMGRDIDPENNSHHMVAVAWNAIALYTYAQRKIGQDNRA